MIALLVNLINLIYWIFWILILGRVIFSFTRISPYHPVRRTVEDLTEPILAPIRQFLPPMGGFDFSPLIALLLADLLRRILFSLL